MRLIKILGAAIVAVFAFSAMAAAGASAHNFTANKESGLILAEADGLQVFTVPTGTVDCKKLSGHGSFATATVLTQLVSVSYTECFAQIKGQSVTVKVKEPITAKYVFNADNEEVSLEAPVTIVAEAAGIKCTVTVAPQSLKLVVYDNRVGGSILLLAHVLNILSSAAGAACVPAYAHDTTGSYFGNSITKVDGGEVKWV